MNPVTRPPHPMGIGRERERERDYLKANRLGYGLIEINWLDEKIMNIVGRLWCFLI